MISDDIKINDIKIKSNDGSYVTLGTTTDGCCGYFIHSDDAVDSLSYATERIITLDVNKLDQRVSGIEELIKGRNNIMNILEYYKKVKSERIKKNYQEIIDEEYNKLEVVDAYKTLINEFDINMKQLAEKYNTKDEQVLVPTCYRNDYAYELSHQLKDEIAKKHNKDCDRDLKNLYDFVDEVQAVLSISDDKEYQIDVLKSYDILDKKGKLNI